MQQHFGTPILHPHSLNCQNLKEELGSHSLSFRFVLFSNYFSSSGISESQVKRVNS